MKNDNVSKRLNLLHESLLERVKEVGNLQCDIKEIKKDKSEDIESIIDGIRRDSLMMKDSLHKVRRKIFIK